MAKKLVLLVAPLVLLSACSRTPIRSYIVPTAHLDTAQSTNTPQQRYALSWTIPGNWQATDPKAMQIAAYTLSSVSGPGTLSITRLSGTGGGLLANINRWRGQIGLSPIPESRLERMTQAIKVGDLFITVVSLNSASQKKSMKVAVVQLPNETWFFKLDGSSKAISKLSSHFSRFVRSITPTPQ